MAQEITATGSLSFTKGNMASAIALGDTSKKFDVTGQHFVRSTQNIGTSAEAIAKGDIGTIGWAYVRNLDATNYCELLDATSGNVFIKLKPGEFFMGRLGCAAPAAKANSSAVNIEYVLVED